MKFTIYTDGACAGNPGKGGWAAVIIPENVEEIRLSGGEPITTNNRMELLAPITALERIKEMGQDIGATIEIISDSAYVVNGITKWVYGWRDRGWTRAKNQPVINLDLWKRFIEIVEGGFWNVSFTLVKGHAGNKYNEICDRMAVAASKNGGETT